MSKDVNIHVKTQGTGQVKQDLQDVTQSVNRVGDNVEQMGSRSSRALEWFASGLKSLAGPLGFAALITAVSSVAGKISQFFSDFKNRCDEAVGNLQNLRKGFEGIFEAMNAFDEKSRQAVTKETVGLLKKTSVSREIGLPVIEQYARQFRGKLPQDQYQQGLEGMLGYAARHGGAATPELITLMGGLGMTSPEQQGVFRRQIGAVSGASGLTDEEIITSLGRASSAATVMGWKPDEMLNYIGTIAAGEINSRRKTTLPGATLEALVNPQVANFKDYRISTKLAANPAQLLATIAAKRAGMDEQAFGRMLRDIYGEASTGVYKLITTPGGAMTGTIKEAATTQAAAAEMAQEEASRQTKERQQAVTDTLKAEEWQKSNKFFFQKQIRELGAEKQKTAEIEHPAAEYLRKFLTIEYKEKEEAAFMLWLQNLSPEEKERILKETKPEYFLGPIPIVGEQNRQIYQLRDYYYNLSPEQQYGGLVGPSQLPSAVGASPVIINNNYSNDIYYGPNIGKSEPRFGREAK